MAVVSVLAADAACACTGTCCCYCFIEQGTLSKMTSQSAGPAPSS
jgi:hypothetical protein